MPSILRSWAPRGHGRWSGPRRRRTTRTSSSASGRGRPGTGRCSGRSARRCCPASPPGCSRGAAGSACPPRPAAAAGAGAPACEPRRERGEQVGEVGALPGAPVACHVGLAEPHLRVTAEACEERAGPHDAELWRPGPRALGFRIPSGVLTWTGTIRTARSKMARATEAWSGARGVRAIDGQRMVVETVMGFRHLPGCGGGGAGRREAAGARARCRAGGSGPRRAAASAGGTGPAWRPLGWLRAPGAH